VVRTKDVDMTIEFFEVEKKGYRLHITSTEMEIILNGTKINSIPLRQRLAYENSSKENDYYYLNLHRYKNTRKEALINEIGMLTPNRLPEKLLLKMPYDTGSFSNKTFVTISSTPNAVIFEIEFLHNMAEWAYPFSVKELSRYLKKVSLIMIQN
jgi:hypothetical protein